MERLLKILKRIDGKSYKAYKEIKGLYTFPDYQLSIDHVQGDPFALPSRISIIIPMSDAGFPQSLWNQADQNSTRKIALEDYLGRCVNMWINQKVKGRRGSGGSGQIGIETGQQQILCRNAVLVSENTIEARLVLGLPANGRRLAAQEAQIMFYEELPQVISHALFYKNLSLRELTNHIDVCEDQTCLRAWLDNQNLVAFIANDSVLPRLSGISDKPLSHNALAFQSPAALRHQVSLPNCGTVTGLGIPKGITLIVGGGFHGKSTVLHALERGVYNHIPGDGRERLVTIDNAVKIRAEDGRVVSKVNISPFIDRLPFGRDTKQFSTENASGSTSQAANIIEAIECGTELLLIDEDTSATNFMIRDERMQKLVVYDKEPITPLLYRVRELYDKHDISSIIVMGGSGDYFSVADTVIMMDAYQPIDVTEKAQALAQAPDCFTIPNNSHLPNFSRLSKRKPGAVALDPSKRNRPVKIDIRGLNTLLYGEHQIDLSLVEQLVDFGQTRSIGMMIHYYATHHAKHCTDLIEGLQKTIHDVTHEGLDSLSPYKVGNLALPRLHELAAAINRIREGQWEDEWKSE